MASKHKSSLPVGKLLCGGFEGTGVTSQAYHLIVNHKVSTFILSKKNSVNVKQMTKLIRDLQYIAYTQGNYDHPIMFAIDQEGGMINALFDAEYLHQFPGAMALAATGDTDIVYQVLKALAIELKQIGFSIIFGPVLDVVTKLSHQLLGVRSFGTTVEEVVKFGKAAALGFRDGGLLTFGKHFPGIGNASVDSLLELPMLTDSLEQVKHFNALPFARLIQEDILDGVCAAGCGVPTISPDEIHACLSPVLIKQLLRNEIGFKGVVISECLEMDSLHHSIGLGQGVLLALYAGCDLILVCHDTNLQNEAVESIQKALVNGNLDEEIVLGSLNRIEHLQRQLPSFKNLFPNGEESAKSEDLKLFRDIRPDLWKIHDDLSEKAYESSITLVRDYSDVLPLPKLLKKPGPKDCNNVLILTPLLNPISRTSPSENDDKESNLYMGEEVFRDFGKLLAEHPVNKLSKTPYNILHTTYTANGLTSLHESLIENSKVVIVVTSEATRNMYQIGIVKYVSVLCGANPSSFNNAGQTFNQLSKPLILVATSSPYDFLYNKSIGSAYLCCYDYTYNSLKQLVAVLMGDVEAEGCIPGEKKYIGNARKRRLTESKEISMRRWLVDEFNLSRDWDGLVALLKNNNLEGPTSPQSETGYSMAGSINYQDDRFYSNLLKLLQSTQKEQKHFVVRNSSLNILYGVILTWIEKIADRKTGGIMYLLVDKTKRSQSIGYNLHVRAIRYLIKEQGCTTLTLGVSSPLITLPNEAKLDDSKVVSFMNKFGWNVVPEKLKKKKILYLDNMSSWTVPEKIFRELMIVGVRFDICKDAQKLTSFIERNCSDEQNSSSEDRDILKLLYMGSMRYFSEDSLYGAKVIIALEPTNQTVIGSIILFTSKSHLGMKLPFMSELDPVGERIIGGIIAPVIDLSYSNLTEIFKYGLICSAITLLKSSFDQNSMTKCLIAGISDDSLGNVKGIKDMGFKEWKYYYDYYDKQTNMDVFENI